MNTTEIRNRLNEKLATLSSEQLYSVWDFIQSFADKNNQKEKNQELAELKQLFKESQDLFKDNPISDEEIVAEIKAYREGNKTDNY